MSIKKCISLSLSVAAISFLFHCTSVSAAPHKLNSAVVSKEGGWGSLEQRLHLSATQREDYDTVIAHAKTSALTIASNRKLKENAKQMEFAGLRSSTLGKVRMLLTSKQQVLLNRAIAASHF